MGWKAPRFLPSYCSAMSGVFLDHVVGTGSPPVSILASGKDKVAGKLIKEVAPELHTSLPSPYHCPNVTCSHSTARKDIKYVHKVHRDVPS